MTQALIGQQLGLSQVHVSRLLASALGYLRPRLFGSPEFLNEGDLDPEPGTGTAAVALPRRQAGSALDCPGRRSLTIAGPEVADHGQPVEAARAEPTVT
jgi:hypothetical protein